jgi:hypothetical protein
VSLLVEITAPELRASHCDPAVAAVTDKDRALNRAEVESSVFAVVNHHLNTQRHKDYP